MTEENIIIIVEGPDGSGKTTLIERLSSRLDIPVAPRVVAKDTTTKINLQDWVEDNLEEGFQRKIFDRHRLISEPIYGPIMRISQQEGFTDREWMHRVMHGFRFIRPITFFCLPPIEVVRKNVENDPDNEAVAKHIDAIYASYLAKAMDDYFLSDVSFILDYTQLDEAGYIELENLIVDVVSKRMAPHE